MMLHVYFVLSWCHGLPVGTLVLQSLFHRGDMACLFMGWCGFCESARGACCAVCVCVCVCACVCVCVCGCVWCQCACVVQCSEIRVVPPLLAVQLDLLSHVTETDSFYILLFLY